MVLVLGNELLECLRLLPILHSIHYSNDKVLVKDTNIDHALPVAVLDLTEVGEHLLLADLLVHFDHVEQVVGQIVVEVLLLAVVVLQIPP